MSQIMKKMKRVLLLTVVSLFFANSSYAMSISMHYGPHGYMYNTIVSDVSWTTTEAYFYYNWYRHLILTCGSVDSDFYQGTSAPGLPFIAHVTLTAPGSVACESLHDVYEMWPSDYSGFLHDEETSQPTIVVRQ